MDLFLVQNVEDDSDTEDFLQDPEMWGDKLPQPYRMIDRILKELLESVWDCIEQRELERQRENTRVKLPEGNAGSVLRRDVLKAAHGGVGRGREAVFVGNEKSIYVVKSAAEIIAKYDLQNQVNSLSVVATNELADMVVVRLDTGSYKQHRMASEIYLDLSFS